MENHERSDNEQRQCHLPFETPQLVMNISLFCNLQRNWNF